MPKGLNKINVGCSAVEQYKLCTQLAIVQYSTCMAQKVKQKLTWLNAFDDSHQETGCCVSDRHVSRLHRREKKKEKVIQLLFENEKCSLFKVD